MKKNKLSKESIANAIMSAASIYKQNLVGKIFLYVFDSRYIEVMYKTRNFCHLTGVETSSKPLPFYKDALSGRLRPGQIHFSSRHPYDLCALKTNHLQNLCAITNSPSIILEEMTTNSAVYEFGLTELKFTLCLNKDSDVHGNAKGDYYIADSLRNGNSLGKSKRHYDCQFIFSKPNSKKLYDTLCYDGRIIRISDLPEEIKQKLSSAFL